ncbi:MAG: hypothetical protein IJA45_01770 [Oscillospiraceae bacterium]|nr:hypothetical protein [Bacteroidaceae bacterium]MBQ3541838.1 hypothetical protein [Oscillospiraceae bacterium]
MNFPAKKPKVISIRVSVELFEKIQKVAKDHGWTVAHAAYYLIQQGLSLSYGGVRQ